MAVKPTDATSGVMSVHFKYSKKSRCAGERFILLSNNVHIEIVKAAMRPPLSLTTIKTKGIERNV